VEGGDVKDHTYYPDVRPPFTITVTEAPGNCLRVAYSWLDESDMLKPGDGALLRVTARKVERRRREAK
jgi:hypothetical protein